MAWDYSSDYLIMAFANQYFAPKGFGLMAIPYSSYSCSGTGTKGTTVTLTGITKAYRFTIGARLRIINSATLGAEVFNLGTIQSIASASSLTVKLDNNTNWGNTIPSGAGVSIEQLDKFRPYRINDSTQTTQYHYYRVIGRVQLETTGVYPVSNIYSYPSQSITLNRKLLWQQNGSGTGYHNLSHLLMYIPEHYNMLHCLGNVTASASSLVDLVILENSLTVGDTRSQSGVGAVQAYYEDFTTRLNENKTLRIYAASSDASAVIRLYLKGYSFAGNIHLGGY
jgi:hypothetical protein